MAEIQARKTIKPPVRGKRKLSFKTRNPADTKERILVAAIKEFSEYGFLGARVERIVRGSDWSWVLVIVHARRSSIRTA